MKRFIPSPWLSLGIFGGWLLLTRKALDAGDKILDVAHLGQVDHNAFKIVMLVVIMAVVMAGACSQIILGSGVEPQNDTRINGAIRDGQNGQRTRQFRLDQRPRGGNASLARKIGLGQKDDIGASNLVFHWNDAQ